MAKRKQYLPTELLNAVNSVKARKLNVTQAAKEFMVPRQTVKDHVSGKLEDFKKPGVEPALTGDEETALADYFKFMVERGFPVNREVLKGMAVELVKRSGREARFNMEKGPSSKWIRKFYSRHPELTEKAAVNRDGARLRMSNEVVIQGFFKKYAEVLDKLNLRHKESQIFNCDETGLTDKDGSHKKVISLKGQPAIQKQVLSIGHMTAHMCVCGDGRVLPSFIIYQGSFPHRNYKDNVPNSWLFGKSESGYMDRELFTEWFSKIFLKYCGRERPVLLLLDNHDSHISLDLIQMARENQVEILGFPAHTTHILQPLDVLIFAKLKEKKHSVASSMSLFNDSKIVGRAKLPMVWSYVIDQYCVASLVKSSFRKCGLIPYNPDAIDKTQLVPTETLKKEKDNKNSEDAATAEASGDAQLPSSSSSSHSTNDQGPVPPAASTNVCPHCPHCMPHSILSVRKLPLDMQALFYVPTATETAKKKSKVVSSARVITGEEMVSQLEKRAKDEADKREGIERRKKEREEKRLKIQKEKEEKQRKKNEKLKEKQDKQAKVPSKKRYGQTNVSKPVDQQELPSTSHGLYKRKRTFVDYAALALEIDSSDSESVNEIESGCESDPENEIVCGECGQRDPDSGNDNTDWIQCECCYVWFHYICVENAEDTVFFKCQNC